MKKLIKHKRELETKVVANKLAMERMEGINDSLKVKGDEIRAKFKKYGKC